MKLDPGRFMGQYKVKHSRHFDINEFEYLKRKNLSYKKHLQKSDCQSSLKRYRLNCTQIAGDKTFRYQIYSILGLQNLQKRYFSIILLLIQKLGNSSPLITANKAFLEQNIPGRYNRSSNHDNGKQTTRYKRFDCYSQFFSVFSILCILKQTLKTVFCKRQLTIFLTQVQKLIPAKMIESFISKIYNAKIPNISINLRRQLGEGSFSKVYAGKGENHESVVIKFIDKSKVPLASVQLMKSCEVNLTKIQHPNILKFFYQDQTDKLFYIVVQRSDISLERLYLQAINTHCELSKFDRIFILYTICKTFNEKKQFNPIHGDLKMANILIKDGKLKIADFGQFQSVEHTGYNKNFHQRYYSNKSPQVLKGGKSNQKSDIWSLGCLAYQIFMEDDIFRLRPQVFFTKEQISEKLEQSHKKAMQKIVNDQNLSEDIKQFLRKCLALEQADRADWAQIYESSIFNELKKYSQKEKSAAQNNFAKKWASIMIKKISDKKNKQTSKNSIPPFVKCESDKAKDKNTKQHNQPLEQNSESTSSPKLAFSKNGQHIIGQSELKEQSNGNDIKEKSVMRKIEAPYIQTETLYRFVWLLSQQLLRRGRFIVVQQQFLIIKYREKQQKVQKGKQAQQGQMKQQYMQQEQPFFSNQPQIDRPSDIRGRGS